MNFKSLNLIWMKFQLIQLKNGKTPLFVRASLQPTTARAPWAKHSLPGPRPGFWPAHAIGALPSVHTASSLHAQPRPKRAPWRSHQRLNDGGNLELFEGNQSQDDDLHAATQKPIREGRKSMAHHWGGQRGKGRCRRRKNLQSFGETLLGWSKSCTRAHRTSSHTLTVTRTSEESTHQHAVGLSTWCGVGDGGDGHGIVGSDEPMPATWSGWNRAVRWVAWFLQIGAWLGHWCVGPGSFKPTKWLLLQWADWAPD
jgi:hypothetical protein